MWQDVGAVLIVGGAVYYLYRKLFRSQRARKAPPSFVPLSDLKRKPPRP